MNHVFNGSAKWLDCVVVCSKTCLHRILSYVRQSIGHTTNLKKTATLLWFRKTRTTWSSHRTDVHKGHGKMLYYYLLLSTSNDLCAHGGASYDDVACPWTSNKHLVRQHLFCNQPLVYYYTYFATPHGSHRNMSDIPQSL